MNGLINKTKKTPINLLNNVDPKTFTVNTPHIINVSSPVVTPMPAIPEVTNLNDLKPMSSFSYTNAPQEEPLMGIHPAEEDSHESLSSYAGSDLTPEETMKKKKILLFRLKRFQNKGFGLSRVYNMESDLIDIQAEVESIKREANLGATVTTMKKGIQISTYLLELLNHQFDPINAKLDGWSNQIQGDLDNGDFDEVLEELYDKYTDRLHMPPEMRLLSMLGTSALQFHIAQVVVKQTLDQSRTDKILRQNPKIKRDIMDAYRNSNETDATMPSRYSETQTASEQKNMQDPEDLGDIFQEIDIEDATNNSTISTDF